MACQAIYSRLLIASILVEACSKTNRLFWPFLALCGACFAALFLLSCLTCTALAQINSSCSFLAAQASLAEPFPADLADPELAGFSAVLLYLICKLRCFCRCLLLPSSLLLGNPALLLGILFLHFGLGFAKPIHS